MNRPLLFILLLILIPLILKSQVFLRTPEGKFLTGSGGVIILSSSPSSSPCPVSTVSDASGNSYNTVGIGNQCWMKENLATTKYNDNTEIPFVSDGPTWSGTATDAYSWYNFDASTYAASYGALYNWHVVNTGKLCPFGWHVPSDAEWTTLTTFLGGESVAGGVLKETGLTHWTSPNSGATNETGFTALPGGNIGRYGACTYVTSFGLWWSSTESTSIGAWSRTMFNYDGSVSSGSSNKRNGFSVRCLRDN